MNYYRCQEGTESYRVLKEIADQIRTCQQASADLAHELGAVSFTLNGLVIGGIGSLRFLRKPDPKEYKIIGVKRLSGHKLYDCVPNIETKQGAKIALRITRLPYVKYDDVPKLSGVEMSEVKDGQRMEITPVEGWVYLSSDMTHRLEGLEPITKENYEQAETYFGQQD